jgi:hypothetical protein
MSADVSRHLSKDADAFVRWGGRVPIILGATGHRNIDVEDAKLRTALKTQCADLKDRYKHSPFVILSALAEGADRLIAEIAMEAPLSAELIAVLPMPQEDYERDFATVESKDQFRNLLKRATAVKTAAVPPGDAWKADGEPRNMQYARAGSIIVDHAQVFFSIWDGKPARGTGGTADQVAWFEAGESPNVYSLHNDAVSPLDPLEPGLSIRIDPVSGETTELESPLPKQVETGRKSNIRWILARTNRYNCDVLRNEARIAAGDPLITEDVGEVVNLALTYKVYRASDSLSVHFRDKVRFTDSVIYTLALGAVTVFNFVSGKAEAPWIYLGITFVMAMLAARVWFRSIDNRFLEYRCLAEAMRTLFFWRNAGVQRSLWIKYLSRQLGVIHWVRHAVRSVEFCQDCRFPNVQADDSFRTRGIQIARKYWIGNQADWFARKETYHASRSKFWKRLARVAFAAAFATAIALALMTIIPGQHGTLWNEYVEPVRYGDYWQALLGLLAGGGVAARGFLSRRAHLELTKQYAAQRQIFETARWMLETIKHDPQPSWTADKILEKLGEEALQEQAEWLWLRHTRPFEMPAAG